MKSSILSFILLAAFTFVSCKQDNNLTKKEDKTEWNKKENVHCFEMIYPVTWTMPDGSNITANDEKEMWAGIKNWYATNPDVESKPTFNYPVDIILKNGQIITISNEEEMIEAKKGCDTKEE